MYNYYVNKKLLNYINLYFILFNIFHIHLLKNCFILQNIIMLLSMNTSYCIDMNVQNKNKMNYYCYNY